MDNNKTKNKIGVWWQAHKPTKRRLIQLYAALLTNANLKGFASGKIYTGVTKNICVPGLNCYSCPGAIGACPLGSLQNALATSKTSSLAYIFGIFILFGLLLGRTICGFLCPFGLIQELLHKIPSPKLGKNRFTRVLSYFKYIIFFLLVLIIPLVLSDKSAVPGFCKYICPSGTLLGAVSLLSNENNSGLFSMLGPLFTWKFCLLVVFIFASVFVFRFFCRFFCPLGAIYGFFNKLALIGVKLDKEKCISCGMCINTCNMDIRHVGDHECISCGSCISVCPTKAIHFSVSKVFIADNGLNGVDAEKKQVKRAKAAKIISLVLAALILIGALCYYNIFDRDVSKEYGFEVGKYCPEFALDGIGGDDGFSLSDASGNVVVINFWATWCGPCVNELPSFETIAEKYPDNLTVIAVHETPYTDGFIERMEWQSYKITFVQDAPQESMDNQTLMELIGKSDALPVTVILDVNGKIAFRQVGSITENELMTVIVPLLNK